MKNDKPSAQTLLYYVRMVFNLGHESEAYLMFKTWLLARPDLIRMDCWELPFMLFIRDYAPNAEWYFHEIWLDSLTLLSD